ncbi:PucR family transcriptional regulator [Streptomyces cyaneochromogenes]|uniref:PucR family transcriptional regulator n=1 Tax=Streptomyces cyaneochromogenes TaxID=2496836 RepID=A0A3Q9F0V5_9ACTN|nr:helix-turn-helix domain-containing protein [Streptomyces cyaneochromogenes]AZQ39744.1 PucR family transcriptional regulator [Streptomyces cyaneochromogenes]
MAGREDEVRQAGTGSADGSAWAEQLLDHLRPTGRDVRRVVAWLADAVDGIAALRDDTGTLLGGPLPPLDDRLVEAVAAGRIASAAWEGQGRHLRLVRVAYPNPSAAGVLAVSRESAFDRRTADIVTHTVQVIELLLKAGETTAAGRRLEQATSDLRLAILQLLMVEDTVSARRVAAGLWPGLLDTDSACVYVVEGTAEERDGLAEQCIDVTGERALVVLCPAVDEHVIVVTPGESEARQLRSLIGPRPRTFLGGSARHSLARIATAYGQAVSALAVAHFRPDKAAVYAERTHPERLIDPAALRGWTDRLLRPLDTLPHHTRAELLATTRLGLEFTAVSTAKVLGVSRNTVRARMERVEGLLRTDFADLTARAVVHLALNIQVSLADTPADSDATTEAAPVPLNDLLSGPAMRTWAQDLLAHLDKDSRDLRRTLRAWIAEGGNAERAAQTLGVHAQTVREHVRSAEPVLQRQLLAGGADLYEVVLAHLTLGDLDQPALRAAK